MDERHRQAILDAVDAGFKAQLALTQRVVEIPSYSKQEAAVQKVVAEALEDLGWEVDAWQFRAADIAKYKGFAPTAEDYEKSGVVVGTLNPKATEGRSLILNGHVDVVPTSDPASWSTDPFDARIADGKLYGRGSGDMKSGLVCGIYAVEALRRAGLRPKGRIHLQSVPDEEGSGNGTLACVERGYTADVALVLEPSAEQYFTAQVGILWWHVEMRGTPQHASGYQGRAPNVIEQAYAVIEAMRKVETHANLPENRHPAYKDHPFPIRLNVGMIEGGNWPSSSPADCRFSGRIAIYPDQDPHEVMEALRQAIADRVAGDEALQAFPPKITFLGNQFSGYEPKGEEAAKALLGAAHQQVHGEAMTETSVAFGSDARVLGQDGGVPSMIYGPISHNLHGLDESVDVESLRRVTKTVALFIADWCGIAAEVRA